MRGNLAGRITEMADCVLIVGHSGIMQHDHVGRAAAGTLVVIRRRPDLCDDGGFGTQFHTRTVFAGAESEFWARTNGSPRRRDCAETAMPDKRPPEAAAVNATVGPARRRPDR